MTEELKSLLATGKIVLDAASEEQLAAYHAMLLEWNRHMDLTNVPEEEMALRHYADSLLPLMQKKWFPDGARLIDVGSGAGFPGMPLAIARPDMNVTLLDAQRKRCDFLQAVADKLELKNVTVIHGRAEEAARSRLRETMDIAVARAVAPMNVLCEYLLPFVRIAALQLCAGVVSGIRTDEETPGARQTASGLFQSRKQRRIGCASRIVQQTSGA